jgi:hypothetical protein
MKKMISNKFAQRFLTVYVMVSILLVNFPIDALASGVSVNVVANGSGNLILSGPTDTFTIDVTSTNASSCKLTSPSTSGIATSASMPIAPGSSFYPSVGGSVTFTVTCDDADGLGGTATASATISLPAPAPAVTADIKANGSDGPVTINSGATFSYTWSSANATSCQLTSPSTSGISTTGASSTFAPGNSFYPAVGGSVTFTINCTDGVTSAIDSVTVNVVAGGAPAIVTADIKANGSNGPVNLNIGDTFTYTWSSANATSCQLVSPSTSGISTSGASSVIASGNSFYPAVGGSVTFTINCTDGVTTATDSVVVNLLAGSPGGLVVTTTLVANPTSVLANATSTLTWTSTNTTSCSAPWTASTAVSGSQVVNVATTTVYSINCSGPSGSAVATATVTVVPVVPVVGGSCTFPTITSPLTLGAVVGQPFSYIITASGTSTPVLTANISSMAPNLTFASSTGVITGTPSAVGTFNISLTATNPCGTDTKVLVITVSPASNGGGGGGVIPPVQGGGGGGSIQPGGTRHPIGGVVSNGLECLYLKDYMRIDFTNNDPVEVMKLQAFLINFEGASNVSINGVFDQSTFDAVSAFQTKYQSDILAPWGETAPTGYVYILTLKKINEIYCQHAFPINDAQAHEIDAFRALVDHLNSQGIQVQLTPGGSIQVPSGTSSPVQLPIVGKATPPKGQNLTNLAAALFAGPGSLANGLACIYQFLIILIVLYIMASLLVDVLYKEEENVLNKMITKWLFISLGIALAILIAYILRHWCIIIPLILALIFSLVWVSQYERQDSIRATVKSWMLVIEARIKTILKK